MGTPQLAAVDALIQRVFAMTLQRDRANANADPPITHLSELSQARYFANGTSPAIARSRSHILLDPKLPLALQEVEADGMGQIAPLMTAELLDRIVVARLIESPPSTYPQSPLQYLIGCYARAANELRNNRTVADSPELSSLATSCKELIVSYAGLVLQGVVPQVGPPPRMGREHATEWQAVGPDMAPMHSCRATGQPRATGTAA